MRNRKRSIDSSDRENWNQIFKGFVKMLSLKEEQLKSLSKGWKTLEDKIKTQHELWISDVHNYEDRLSLMKNEIERLETMRLVEIAKSSLLLGLNDRNRSLCYSKLEHTQDELDDFKAWFDILTLNKNGNSDSGDADCRSLEANIRKMKIDFEKLAFPKRSELSTLLGETGFAWSQFKHIESGFTEKLMRKDEEIIQANKKIASLQEQLHSSNHEKYEIISRFKAKVAEMSRQSASKKDDIIPRRSDEVKSLRRSRRLAAMNNS